MNVLKRINQLRIERNWSVYRLSIESGLPQSTITNMFNRETLPSITTLELICQAFGISMSEFFAEPTETEKSVVCEKEMMEAFQSLDDGTKRIVLDLMKELGKRK